MPDSRTGFTGTQVEAEPESSAQSQELAGHEIHLDGESENQNHCCLACMWIFFPSSLQTLHQDASQTWMFCSVEHSSGGG